MTTNMKDLDLASNPRHEIGERILSVSNALFDSVKKTPLTVRDKFPQVLKNNNFALVARVTKKYAFLEVTTKLKAQRTRDNDRVKKYREFFTPKESNLPAAISIDNSRYMRIEKINLRGTHAISLGSDVSLCLSEVKRSSFEAGNPITSSLDILYVVAFGAQIREDDAWQEFDALIRVTLSDWSHS